MSSFHKARRQIDPCAEKQSHLLPAAVSFLGGERVIMKIQINYTSTVIF
jgi:hypothetical protein